MSDASLEQFAQQYAESHQEDGEDIEQVQPDEETEDEAQETEQAEDTPEEDSEEGQAQEQPAEDPVYEWETASGEKFSEPLSELKAGYMRQQDYTQKTQEVAKERAAIRDQVQQQFQQVQQYAVELGQLAMQDQYVKQLEAQIGQFNRQDDPAGYNAAVSELLMAQRQRDGLAAQITQIQQARTAEQQQANIAAQQQAAQALTSGPNALPGFGPEMVQKLNETGRRYGLTDQELASITNPAHIRILHAAMERDEMKAKVPGAVNKVKQAPIKPPKQTNSKPASGIEKDIKQFQGKKDLNSFARLLQHTL